MYYLYLSGQLWSFEKQSTFPVLFFICEAEKLQKSLTFLLRFSHSTSRYMMTSFEENLSFLFEIGK